MDAGDVTALACSEHSTDRREAGSNTNTLWSVEEISETDCAQPRQFFKTIPSENGIDKIRRMFCWCFEGLSNKQGTK